jgi:hypothetical protein
VSPEAREPRSGLEGWRWNPRLLLAAIALLLVVAALAAYTRQRLQRVAKREVLASMAAPHRAAVRALTAWADDVTRAASSASAQVRVAAPVVSCLHTGPCDATTLDVLLSPHVRAAGFRGYRVLDLLAEVRAAGPGRREPIALSDAVRRHLREGPEKAAHVLLPFLDAEEPTLLVAAPIEDATGVQLGTLLFELDIDDLGRVLHAARAGPSIETYAFDRQGRMVTESRFVAQLVRIGLLPAGSQRSALRVEVRDPCGDLTQGFRARTPRSAQPLTQMAASAVAGQSGSDVDGYHDYRGVDVLGVWRWLPQLGLGVATEIDAADAFATLHELEQLFSILVASLALAVLASIAAMAIAERLRRRARRAEHIAARFGQYHVVRKLGEGGMGVVYLATHDRLRRPAAIKLLRSDRVSADAVVRFEREVRTTSALTHPNTVAVYDYGRAEDGTLYYAMEYLEGLDLQRMVERFGPLPPARVCRFLHQLCGSLAEAHAAGVVHRDIKPANLLVCTRGGVADTLKVLDFGIAHVGRSERMRLSKDKDKSIVGTPAYMAPELFESASLASVQADLYSVGAVAYFLLTGAPPFAGDSAEALCHAHLSQSPPPITTPTGAAIDAALERVVLSCLEKRPEMRPSSALGLRGLLERVQLTPGWSASDADGWWQQHRARLVALAKEADAGSTTIREIRPAYRT